MHGSLVGFRDDRRAGCPLRRELGLALLVAALLPACTPSPVSVQINPPGGATPAASGPGTSSLPAATPAAGFSCDFPSAATDCGFMLQAAAPDRAMIVGPGRDAPTAAQLTTEPGDINLFGSGTAERADLELPPSSAYCNQGQEEWWAHSLMFPGGYVIPLAGLLTLSWGVVFDFHHTGSSGQANFQIVSLPTGLELWIAGGPTVVNSPSDPGFFSVPIGTVQFDVWYDFVYHVLWSSGSDGYFQAWLNNQQVMNYSGPTLYAGQSCYLKLADYHTALGLPVSVIHSHVVRGATRADVQLPSQ
jgi:Polysaccharide lyase